MAIDTQARLAALQDDMALTLVPPVVNTQPGPEYTYAQLDYAMIAGLDRTPGGRLWVAWFGGGDSDKGFMLIAKSDDDGRTWSEPQAVIHSPMTPGGYRHRHLVGTLWTDPAGRLWWFFDNSIHYFDGRAGSWATVCENPDADRPMWSTPRRIWHGCTLNKPTVLSTGEWLLPISLWQRDHGIGEFIGTDLGRELDPHRMAHWFVSSDGGSTWSRRGGVNIPCHDFDEHMVVERADGRLVMFARTLYGMAQCESPDDGRSWSAPEPSPIPHVNARFFFRKLADGAWLLVKHGNMTEKPAGRSHLTAWLSDDEGRSWCGGLLLDERAGVSYPDGFQAPDGRIFIAYDHNRATDRELCLAVFHPDDIRAGRVVTPQARLRHRISISTGPARP